MTTQAPVSSFDITYQQPGIAGGIRVAAALHRDRLELRLSTGVLAAFFAFPQLGRPHFPEAGNGSDPVMVLGPDRVTVTVVGLPSESAELVRAALADRIALVASGDPTTVIPLELGSSTPVDGGVGFPLLGRPAERQLYDVALRAGTVGWEVVAPHAVYYRSTWTDFGLAHITDTHVARRIDSFRPTLRDLGLTEAAARMCNMNDQFRGFVSFANRLHAAGELDVIVATGDLIDYVHETDDDREGLGNAGFLRDLILGRAPGPDWPTVEELRVPILMTPGNHDYRRHPYHLVFDVNLGGQDIQRVRNFSELALLEREAMALTNTLYFPGATEVPNLGKSAATAMVEIDPTLRAFRQALADPGPHVARLGKHRVVLVDSAHDVGMPDSATDALWELVKEWWNGSGDEDFLTLIGGSPNCEGVNDEEYAVAVDAIESAPDDGLIVLGLHAPLINPWNGETPFFLRETQRPALAQQAAWWVQRHTGATSADLMSEHPDWFARPGEGEPAYLKRGTTQDLLDAGVSRGRTDDLLQALAGVGTRRRADVVLAGHTHRYNEISIRVLDDGTLSYFLDFYTANPRAWYPNKVVRVGDVRQAAGGHLDLPTTKTYVEVDEDAIAHAEPHPMPWDATHDWVTFVPPYADPLATSADPRAWWDRHKPLQLQTGALGLWENNQVSFSGLRLLSVRGDVIQRVHFLPRERLDAYRWELSLEQAAAPEPRHQVLTRERTRRFGSPPAASAPLVLTPAAGGNSVVYRDGEGYLVELWDVPGSAGAGRLAGRDVAPAAVGSPSGFVGPDGTAVVLFRGDDRHIHSLYWAGTASAGHDALSQSCEASEAEGDPSGYVLAGITHVFYRTADGHIEELWWPGAEAVSHGHITGYCDEPLAAGDPQGYPVTTTAQNIVLYRGVDGHVHSLYWSDGPTGHDNLSGYCGSPLAAGDPFGYHLPHLDSHQVVYRSADGHLHEIGWAGAAPASAWDVVGAAGAPPAAADPACWFVPANGTKHISYAGVDGHVHDLAWPAGTATPTWTDLTLSALAPPAAAERVTGWVEPGSATCRVAFRGTDGHLHEIRWG
ncbi:MAG TPA: metallophosphoesterase [Dermatophilaceae bacterium]|nr:metallophosphoesterase [Dermatophilaceae bacterium]